MDNFLRLNELVRWGIRNAMYTAISAGKARWYVEDEIDRSFWALSGVVTPSYSSVVERMVRDQIEEEINNYAKD